MRLGIVGAGTCSYLPALEKAGFTVSWKQEFDGIARRIQRENGHSSTFRIPEIRDRVDAMLFFRFGEREKQLVALEKPRIFLVESEGTPSLEGLPYDAINATLNSARFFTAHARTRNYTFCVRTNENPEPDFDRLLSRLYAEQRRVCYGMRDKCSDVSEFVLIRPSKKGGRSVFKSLHPCPEIDGRATMALREFRPHPCDSALPAQARILREDQMLAILGLEGLKRPRSVSARAFFRACGKSLDAELAFVLSECLLGLLQGPKGAERDPVMRGVYEEQTMFRKSAMAFVTGAASPSSVPSLASSMAIDVVQYPRLELVYKHGRNTKTDAVFDELAGTKLLSGMETTIKERKRKTRGFDRVCWAFEHKVFRSKTLLSQHLSQHCKPLPAQP